MQRPGTPHALEVNPRISPKLAGLEELANDLRCYSWEHATRAIFSRLHPALWEGFGHSPRALLKRVDERRLLEAAGGPACLSEFNRFLAAYESSGTAAGPQSACERGPRSRRRIPVPRAGDVV